MTTKQIAEAAGVSTDTVLRKGRELFPARFEKGKKTVFTQSEAVYLMAELRKKGFIQPTQNAEALPQNAEALDAAFKAAMITLTAMAQSLDARLTKIETRIDERQALLPAPALEPRQRINMLVREYATKTGATFPDAWVSLYREFGYRMHMNPGQCARNRGMTILDYIEAEGLIGDLEAIAADWAR